MEKVQEYIDTLVKLKSELGAMTEDADNNNRFRLNKATEALTEAINRLDDVVQYG